MEKFQHISPDEAAKLIDQGAQVVDIRDTQSYFTQHVDGALCLGSDNLHDFIQEADLDAPLVVYCYHGISSQSAANLLADQGFEEVYSLDGGFEAWQNRFPDRCVK